MKERRYQPTYPASCHRQCPVRPQSAPPSAAGCQYWWPQNSPSCQCQHCNTIHQHFTWCWRSVNSSFCHCQHYNTITSQDVYAHKTACTANASTTTQLLHMFMLTKQPVLPMQALQRNYFTWCLCSQNSLYCQCKHYNAITSHDVHAYKTAHAANASTTMQLFLMTFMLFLKKTAHSANASTTMQLLHMMFIFKKQPVLTMPAIQALQRNYFTWHLRYLKKQPILPMPALQCNYFTWCLYF